MGKRRKKRTHVPQEEVSSKVPRSFVMERGAVGKAVGQLVLDMRQVMEPHTASKLKVQHRNNLKDFVHVAGPLGVSHFLMFSTSDTSTNLKIAKVPRGPTITFHVKEFCLCRDVVQTVRKPVSDTLQYFSPPLLVLNNFDPEELPHRLTTTLLQNMFPPINVHSVQLAHIRRCLLVHFNSDTKEIELRHYHIKVVPTGVSRPVKKLIRTKVPDLSKYQDIADFIAGGNVSESEVEDEESRVTLPQDMPGRGNIKAEQSAIKLTELGPRMTLQLVKIEEGFCEGEVLHHAFITKTKKEVKELRKKLVGRKREREARRRQQEENVRKKERERREHKAHCLAGQRKKPLGEECSAEEEVEDDSEWFRREVGAEPDPDMFISGKSTQGRRKRGLEQRESEETRGDVCGDGKPPLRKKASGRKKGSHTNKAHSRSVGGKDRAQFRLRVRQAARVDRGGGQ